MCLAPEPAGSADLDADEFRPIRVPVSGGAEMPVKLYVPPESPHGSGTVLLLSDIFGGGKFLRRFAAMLAAEGYAVAAPDIFFRVGDLPEPTMSAALRRRAGLDDGRLLDDLAAVMDWLAGDQGRSVGVGPGELVTMGFCIGGTFAMRLATGVPAGAVAYYGFPAGDGAPSSAPTPLEMADRIVGPLLGFWGGQDDHIRIADVELFDRTLDRLGTEHDIRIFAEEGHNFMAGLFRSGAPSAAAVEAWQLTQDFLRARLSGHARRQER